METIYRLQLGPGSMLFTGDAAMAMQQALSIAKDTGRPASIEVLNEDTGGGYCLTCMPDGSVERMPRR